MKVFIGSSRFQIIPFAFLFLFSTLTASPSRAQVEIKIAASTELDLEADQEEIEISVRDLFKRIRNSFEVEQRETRRLAKILEWVTSSFRFRQMRINAERILRSGSVGADMGSLALTTELAELAISFGGGAIAFALERPDIGWSILPIFKTEYLCITGQIAYWIIPSFKRGWRSLRVHVLVPAATRMLRSGLFQKPYLRLFEEKAVLRKLADQLQIREESGRLRLIASAAAPPNESGPSALTAYYQNKPFLSLYFSPFRALTFQEKALALKRIDLDSAILSNVPKTQLEAIAEDFGRNIQSFLKMVFRTAKSGNWDYLANRFYVQKINHYGPDETQAQTHIVQIHIKGDGVNEPPARYLKRSSRGDARGGGGGGCRGVFGG